MDHPAKDIGQACEKNAPQSRSGDPGSKELFFAKENLGKESS